MSVFDYFRNFLGFPPKPQERESIKQDEVTGERSSEFHRPVWGMSEDDYDDFKARPRQHYGFPIDSDPFEMHRFFEQQFDEMLRRFQSFSFGNMTREYEHPKRLPEREICQEKGLWEHYLKPGYDTGDLSRGVKKDSDLDAKVSTHGIDQFFKTTPSMSSPQTKCSVAVNPDDYLTNPDNFFSNNEHSPGKLEKSNMFVHSFGQSVTKKTVRRPDGSVEHHHTVKDSKGNEETTITRQIGEQSYSVTTKTKANGEQEFIKNFINLDEDNLENFEKKWGRKL